METQKNIDVFLYHFISYSFIILSFCFLPGWILGPRYNPRRLQAVQVRPRRCQELHLRRRFGNVPM